MGLSEIGEITKKYWQEIPNHFLNVKLDEYVIMPNHLHGIIEIINNIDFQWQPRFYDHIIRNESELNRIRQYIINNSKKWNNDRNNLQIKNFII